MLDTSSLAATLIAVDEALLQGEALPQDDADAVVDWILGRQDQPGAYLDFYAATAQDVDRDAHVLSGERLKTGAGRTHVLGEEACRILGLLEGVREDVRASRRRAHRSLRPRLDEPRNRDLGTYCCGTCSVALWRNVAAGGFAVPDGFVRRGLATLRGERKGDGSWRRFPFYYTVLALPEINLPEVRQELRYAAPAIERRLSRQGDDPRSRRRTLILERALGAC